MKSGPEQEGGKSRWHAAQSKHQQKTKKTELKESVSRFYVVHNINQLPFFKTQKDKNNNQSHLATSPYSTFGHA